MKYTLPRSARTRPERGFSFVFLMSISRAGAVSVRVQGGSHKTCVCPPWHDEVLRYRAQEAYPSLSSSRCCLVFSQYRCIGFNGVFSTPNLIFTTEQIAATPELELAFEHLQRNVGVHETISTALRVNEIFDRETVVGFDIPEAWMKPNAADFGVDLPGGSIAHKRGV